MHLQPKRGLYTKGVIREALQYLLYCSSAFSCKAEILQSTSNYAARKFGVRAAMPGFIAEKLCPNLKIVPCNFEEYTKISGEIREVMSEYDPNFSPMSLDEAYLDITELMDKRKSSLTEGSVLIKRQYRYCNA